MFFVLCLLCLCAHLFICALWPPAGKGLTSWLSFVVSNCEFVTFPLVWYLIVSNPDLCTLTYFKRDNKKYKVLNQFIRENRQELLTKQASDVKLKYIRRRVESGSVTNSHGFSSGEIKVIPRNGLIYRHLRRMLKFHCN